MRIQFIRLGLSNTEGNWERLSELWCLKRICRFSPYLFNTTDNTRLLCVETRECFCSNNNIFEEEHDGGIFTMKCLSPDNNPASAQAIRSLDIPSQRAGINNEPS